MGNGAAKSEPQNARAGLDFTWTESGKYSSRIPSQAELQEDFRFATFGLLLRFANSLKNIFGVFFVKFPFWLYIR